jgi:hypothetical protein
MTTQVGMESQSHVPISCTVSSSIAVGTSGGAGGSGGGEIPSYPDVLAIEPHPSELLTFSHLGICDNFIFSPLLWWRTPLNVECPHAHENLTFSFTPPRLCHVPLDSICSFPE